MQKDVTSRLELELSVHLEEYKAKTSDMSSEINALHQTFTLTITAIGFTLAAAPFIIQSQLPLIFAAASLVFYSLTLTQLRHGWTVLAVEDYIAQSLRPSIQEILEKISPRRKQSIANLLLWSTYQSRSAYTSKWWQFPLEAARYLIPIGAGISCCIAYLIMSFPKNNFIANGVITINAFATLYIVFTALSMRRQFIKDKNQHKQTQKMNKSRTRKTI